MKYAEDVRGNENRNDFWRIEDYLSDALALIARAMETAEAAGFDAVGEDLIELESAVENIQGGIEDAMSWIERGADEDEFGDAEGEEAGGS